jgi:hypothetical protein
MPWALFAIGAGTFWSIGSWLRLPRATIGALTLVGGLGNTSFVGLPMIESLQGSDGVGLGLLIDQLGSYLALSTVGVLAAALYSAEQRGSGRTMAIKVVTFPPFIALVVAMLLRPLPLPAPLDATLVRLGDTLAPLALLSVGLQLRFDALSGQARLLSVGLGFKLLACPGARSPLAARRPDRHDEPRQCDRGGHATHDRCRHRRGRGQARRATGVDDDRRRHSDRNPDRAALALAVRRHGLGAGCRATHPLDCGRAGRVLAENRCPGEGIDVRTHGAAGRRSPG